MTQSVLTAEQLETAARESSLRSAVFAFLRARPRANAVGAAVLEGHAAELRAARGTTRGLALLALLAAAAAIVEKVLDGTLRQRRDRGRPCVTPVTRVPRVTRVRTAIRQVVTHEHGCRDGQQ